MNTILISGDEVQCGRISPDHLADAVLAVKTDGYVILQNVVDLDQIALLRDKMLADLPAFIARSDAPYNFNKSNIQHDPPPFSPYLFRDILVNEIVIAVTYQVLGNGVKNGYYSGNTALNAGGLRQPAHADVGQLWPNLSAATPAFGLVVNVPLVDVTPENGSTELWPGTHLDTSIAMQAGDIKVDPVQLEAQRAILPPIQPNIPVGSVVIRDIRMWHAGMPNHTPIPRIMIAMIHWVSWWNDNDVPCFLEADREFFKHAVLRTSAHFVKGPIDYTNKSESYDYREEDQGPRTKQ